jgi:hypothetical protein
MLQYVDIKNSASFGKVLYLNNKHAGMSNIKLCTAANIVPVITRAHGLYEEHITCDIRGYHGGDYGENWL